MKASLTIALVLGLGAPAVLAQPAAPPNHVLDLDGQGDFVRLPPAGFTNFHQATIEAWVKWQEIGYNHRAFDFGGRRRELHVSAAGAGTPAYPTALRVLVVDDAGTRRRVDVYGGVRLDEWSHVAVVTGPGGLRLYLNGVLAATNDFEGSLASLGGENYLLGRENYTGARCTTLRGQLDEVRVWSVRRTAEEIGANLKEYLSFSIKFLLAFGLVFEFPVVLLLLARIGVVDARTLARQRRYAILLIFVFAAVVTPPDLI